MNKKTEKIIKRYLEAEHIPFALLLDGEWGSGKTWFIKNKFKSIFKKEVIYTSANGIKSLEDISQQILYRKLYLKSDLIKDPKAKLAWGIAKQFGKSLIEKYTGYNVEQSKELGVDLNDFASIGDNEVLIIDDIERMNPEISTEDLLGYISTNFTEENKFKVILIADEEQLLQKLDAKSDQYLKIKEKTIWQTVQYKTELSSLYDNLLKPYKKDTRVVLSKNKSFIIDLLVKYKISNLRWVLYFFQIIEDITKSDRNILTSSHSEILVNSILITCKEYKRGFLTNREEEELPEFIKQSFPVYKAHGKIYSYEEGKFIENEQKPETSKEVNHNERFSDLYLSEKEMKYFFFENIYKLVCLGFYDHIDFKNELKEYEDSKKNLKPWEKTLIALKSLLDLEEDDFNKEWKKLISYIYQDKYDIIDLRNIAGMHHTYKRVGIKFPITTTELYKLLSKKTNECDNSQKYNDDTYSHFRAEFQNESQAYKKFMNLSLKVEADHITDDRRKRLNKILDKVKAQKYLQPDKFALLFAHGDKKSIKKISKSVTESNKVFMLYEKALNKSFSGLRMTELKNRKARSNVEYFLRSMAIETKLKNIIKFKITRMKNMADKNYLQY